MRSSVAFFILLLYLWNNVLLTDANAMLNPTHRGVMWTRGVFNSAGYNYMGINCGGISRLKKNKGQCGLCGDAYNGPRNHETGGKYATGNIADVVDRGQRNMNVKILLNNDQRGYFEFRLCESNGTRETQECFDKHLLKITEGRPQGDEFGYIVDRAGLIHLHIEIPERVYCEKCVLQWKYVTGNTFGRDQHGIGCLGCGPQETYVNCADITIKGWEMPPTPAPFTSPVPTTMSWTTSTIAPTTTTPPPPPPVTHAPSTIASRPIQITRAKPTQNTQRTFITRHRNVVTDADEGSRRRLRNGNDNYSKANSPVAAPKAPVVLPQSPQRSSVANGIPIHINPAPAVHPSPVVTETPKPMQAVQANNAGSAPKETKKVLNRERKRNVPFKIPRPPMLSSEQIDALNNNKNIVPHHDPLQKYVKVGSSRIIAAVDFTTMRAQQVQTPPTLVRNDLHKPKATDSTLSARDQHGMRRNMNMYSSFGNEMLGAPEKKPATQQKSFGSNLMNEYATVSGSSFDGSRNNAVNSVKSNLPLTSGDLFNEFAFDHTNGNVLNSKKRMLNNAQKQYVPTNAPRQSLHRYPHLFADKSQISTSEQKQTSRQDSWLSSGNSNSQLLEGNMYGTSAQNRALNPMQTGSFGPQMGSVFIGQQQSRSAFDKQQQLYNSVQPTLDYNSNTHFGGRVKSIDNNMAKQNTFYEGTVPKPMYDNGLMTRPPVSQFGKSYTEQAMPGRHIPPNRNQINEAHISNSGNVYDSFLSHNKSPFGTYVSIADKARKTTRLPVADTSTHRSGKSNFDITAPQMQLTLKPNQNANEQNLQDVPINLFKNKQRNTFKAPVVFERYTNYQIGKSRDNPNTVPENVQKASNFQQQRIEQATNMSAINENLHLNTDIHSPQTYFGQDHYIAHNVQNSVPAFGGPETLDFQSQQELNLGHHEIPPAQTAPQSFRNKHLNYALHSPENYIPHEINKHHQAAEFPLKVVSTKTKPDIKNAHIQGVSSSDATSSDTAFGQVNSAFDIGSGMSKQITPRSQSLKTTTAQTTNALNFQMKELNSLREKLERLQNLINQRTVGFQQETTTTPSPFFGPQPSITHSESNQALTHTTSNSFNNNFQINKITNVPMYNNNFTPKKSQYTGFKPSNKIAASNVNMSQKPSTSPPNMSRETTEYINALKTHMLQSIKDANARKKQQVSGPFTLLDKNSDVFVTKSYNKETTTYVTPLIPPGYQRSQVIPEVLQSQSQMEKQQNMKQWSQKQSNTNNENELLKQKREQERKQKYRQLIELLVLRKRQKQLAEKQQQATPVVTQPNYTPLYANQQQNQNFHQSKQMQNLYQQSLQQKPIMAEVQTHATERQRLLQRTTTTSIRPVETIEAPNRASQSTNIQKSLSNGSSDKYKPTAVKTTINKLADRIAIGMAEKLKAGRRDSKPNFEVVPLSSDSVMETLRNIAMSVLKDQNIRSDLPNAMSSNRNVIQKARAPETQVLEKPSAREMHLSQSVTKQKIISVNGLTTRINENNQIPSAQKTITSNQSILKQGSLSPPTSASPDRLSRRQELIRKMKRLLLTRRPTHVENTESGNNNRPAHLPTERPSHIGQPENTRPLRFNNNRPVHIIDHPNNGRPTIYDEQTTMNQNVLRATNNRLSQSPVGPVKQKNTTGINVNTSVTRKAVQDAQNNRSNNGNDKRRLSPDMARSMLARVRQMLTKNKSYEGKSNSASSNTDNGMSTKDVLVMPLRKDVLFKLLRSMQNKKSKGGS